MNFKKYFLVGLVLILAFAGLASAAQSDAFPSKPVTIVVTFPPGGRSDLSARILAGRFQKLWGQAVVVANRAGAGGTIGSRFVADAKADGYTILFTTSALISAQYLIEKAPRLEDFQALSVMEISYPVLVARKGLNLSLNNLAASSAGAPTRFSIGFVPGATPQILTEALLSATKSDMTRVPFKGESEAVAALLGDHVDLFASSWATVQGHVKAGKLEPIAVASPVRQPDIPGVPTFREYGLDWTLEVFQAFFVPKATPRDIARQIEEAIKTVMDDPSLINDMKAIGLIPRYLDARQSESLMSKQNTQFKAVVDR